MEAICTRRVDRAMNPLSSLRGSVTFRHVEIVGRLCGMFDKACMLGRPVLDELSAGRSRTLAWQTRLPAADATVTLAMAARRKLNAETLTP
jgi:hypothetical protein